MTDLLQPRAVEQWLQSLSLSGKSKAHVRGMMSTLVEYGMFSGAIPIGRNPMSLIKLKGVNKRVRQKRVLTPAEFQLFLSKLDNPILRTIALTCLCLGLRISESLALRWSDIDWLHGNLTIERAIVDQRIAETKTDGSRRSVPMDAGMAEVLKHWRQQTQFSQEEDWVFGSPVQLGRLPVSYPWVWRSFHEAATEAGLGSIGTHSLRHSFRSWLDSCGTSIGTTKDLMRHASIKTSFDVYGAGIPDDMRLASHRVTEMALGAVA